GAEFCIFCDKDKRVINNLENNLSNLKVPSSCYRIIHRNVLKNPFIPPASSKFNLIFLDPPYILDFDKVLCFVDELKSSNLFDKNNYLVYEHSSLLKHEEICNKLKNYSYELLKSNKISTTSYEIFST
ncbi:MAG: RsmD family RNA methyltransferase, partial [Enterococcus sp.]|nr:RsmD family RNA methyltransferase [Enterococcus sp.]